MSTQRAAQTIVVTLVRDDEHTLGQLRISGGEHERTWALDFTNRDNVIGTVREAISDEVERALAALATSDE